MNVNPTELALVITKLYTKKIRISDINKDYLQKRTDFPVSYATEDDSWCWTALQKAPAPHHRQVAFCLF